MNIKTKHLFKIIKVLKKTGVLENMKDMYSQDTKGKTPDEISAMQENVGIEIMMGVIGGLEYAEKDIYELLGDIQGKKPKEIEEQDPSLTIDAIKEIIQNEAFVGFLGQATKSEETNS